MIHYPIPLRSHKCLSCGVSFVENQELMTLLTPIKGGYSRSDYCLACFSLKKEKSSDDLSYWKVTILPKPEKEKFKKAEDFLSLLRMETNPSMRYFLCLFLQRQRVLTKQQEKKDDLFFECVASGEVFVAQKVPIDPSLGNTFKLFVKDL